jgi:tripartite-type tricarboxylate transporter receptor subunit TctC
MTHCVPPVEDWSTTATLKIGATLIFAEYRMPHAIVTCWNSEVNRFLQRADVKERMAGDGMESSGGPPQRFSELLVRDIARWQRVVKMANIKISA